LPTAWRSWASKITADYDGQSTGHPLVLIGGAEGSGDLLSDLARAITIDKHVRLRGGVDYGRARVSSGAVKLIKDIDNPNRGAARDSWWRTFWTRG